MDDYMDYNVDEMFEEQYGDISFTEPPEIEQNDEQEEEFAEMSSFSSSTAKKEEKNKKENKNFDDLILDKQDTSEKNEEQKRESQPKKEVSQNNKNTAKKKKEQPSKEKTETNIKTEESSQTDDVLTDDCLRKDFTYSTEKTNKAPDIETSEIPSQSEDKSEKAEEKVQEEMNSSAYNDTQNTNTQETYGYAYSDEPGDGVINSEPYDIPLSDVYEVKDFSIPSFVKKFSKLIACAAMIIVLIGIPLLFSTLSHSSSNRKVVKKHSNKVSVTTESHIDLDKALIESNGFDEAREAAYSSMSNTNESSRFKNLDELTFYLNSNMASTLALEKALATQYENGKISREYYYSQLSVHREFVDELNHLLTINKKTYQNENMEDEYNTLVNDMDALILYGDTLYYGGTEKSL